MVGEEPNTSAPVPVSFVTADARLALVADPKKVAIPDASPLTPVEMGSPVAFVMVPDEGVPRAGVTSVGLVANTRAPLPVSSVVAAAKLELEGVAKNVATLDPKPLTPVEIGSPVAFVKVPDVGVPKMGVTSVGDVENTTTPVPVSLLNTPAS